jgi:LCP family protein required for cell wall assembly
MSPRRFALPIAIALLLVSCSGENESTEPPRPSVTSTTSTTTTTLPPTTTTTLPPLAIEGAGEPLTDFITGFYGYATGGTEPAPPMPEAVLALIDPAPVDVPREGIAAVHTFAGQQIGVVEMAEDVFLLVDDGTGWRIVGGVWPSLEVGGYWGAGPRLVAVVGSDARPGQAMDRSRADSIHFVALDGAGGGAVVGLPRDSFVEIPGQGRRKITGSLSSGGPETMMATFDQLTGLPLEGYVLTGFAGFQELAGTVLGGVEVEVPMAINDRWAKVTLDAGQQLLNGAEALGFARARKTVGGDFVRSEHQGVLLLGAARMVAAMGYTAIPRLLELAEPHLMTDLSPEQLLTFSALTISSRIDEIPNVVAPGRSGSAGGASVVFLDDSVDALWDDLADGTLEQ